MRRPPPMGCGLRLEDVTVLPPFYHAPLKEEMAVAAGDGNASGSGHHPLTGTIAVAWAVRNAPEWPVYVIGLDMAFGGEYQHYGRAPLSRKSLDVWHKVGHDAAYLMKLLREGVIAPLDVPRARSSAPRRRHARLRAGSPPQ